MPKEWLPDDEDTEADKRRLTIEAWAIGIAMVAVVLVSMRLLMD